MTITPAFPFAIWKFPLATQADLGSPVALQVEMPHKSKILSVQEQNSALYLWALVPLAQPSPAAFIVQSRNIVRRFIVLATGERFDGKGTYIGTVQFDNGYVAHVFERTE